MISLCQKFIFVAINLVVTYNWVEMNFKNSSVDALLSQTKCFDAAQNMIERRLKQSTI